MHLLTPWCRNHINFRSQDVCCPNSPDSDKLLFYQVRPGTNMGSLTLLQHGTVLTVMSRTGVSAGMEPTVSGLLASAFDRATTSLQSFCEVVVRFVTHCNKI